MEGQYRLYLRRSKCYAQTKEEAESKKLRLEPFGIEAQRQSVYSLVGKDAIAQEYVEIETASGKKQRPVLDQAIQDCISNKQDLIVAKLDRLTREPLFLFKIRDMMKKHNLKIIFADLPNAPQIVIVMMAAIAELELEIISNRQKSVANIIKQTGITKSGRMPGNANFKNPEYLKEYQMRGAATMKEKALNNKDNQKAGYFAITLKQSGLSLYEIADKLNDSGFRTSQGSNFFPMQVSRLIKRYDSKTTDPRPSIQDNSITGEEISEPVQ